MKANRMSDAIREIIPECNGVERFIDAKRKKKDIQRIVKALRKTEVFY